VEKKVCLVHYSSSPGGIEVLMPEIVKMFPGTGFSVFVIRPPVSGSINVYENSALQVTYGSRNNFTAAYRLWRFLRSNRDAIIHGFNIGPFFLLIIRLAGIRKSVYSLRGTLHYNNFLQKVIRRAVWRMATAPGYRFIANSEYSRDVFLRYINLGSARINVIYNPVNSDRLKHSQIKKDGQQLDIIYVGRLAEGKNLFRWLDIAVSIHKVRSDSRFFLYGDGPLKYKLIGYCRDIGANDIVFFKGYVQEITQVYMQAEIMMFLSEYESFGNAVVESILCGTPVIATDIPSMREIFRNHPQFLVAEGDQMESRILEMISNLNELKKLVPKASGEFGERFSIGQHINGLRQVYDSFDGASQGRYAGSAPAK
jgi:glycosyltransferase involved in cell wall biosynthesis